jgi:hypothetical protein
MIRGVCLALGVDLGLIVGVEDTLGVSFSVMDVMTESLSESEEPVKMGVLSMLDLGETSSLGISLGLGVGGETFSVERWVMGSSWMMWSCFCHIRLRSDYKWRKLTEAQRPMLNSID